MGKTKVCEGCGHSFPITLRVNGKTKSLRSRRLCLDCSPYRGSLCQKLKCKNCQQEFEARQEVNGKRVGLYSRDYCLVCVPFGETGRSVFKQQPHLRICTVCGEEYIYDRVKGHKAKRCNSCATVTRHIAKKKRCIAYKGGACILCGYNSYYGSLDFHHRDPEKKNFQIGRNISRKWEDLKMELDKCDLVCRNCHGEIHGGLAEIPR